MKKIKSLFKRDYEGTRLAYNEIVEGCEWVINGEGIATRKFDGTPCMIKDCEIYKRYDVKNGKTPPGGFIACQGPDKVTGHWPGWIKCDRSNKSDKYFFEAFDEHFEDGTYELCGPKINKNKEMFSEHVLVKHGMYTLSDCPRDFDNIKKYLEKLDIEGIVWHRENGDMCKIKKKDFGFKR